MDQLSDIEARRDATAENLRRAFGAPVGGESPTFAALLERLAAKGLSRDVSRESNRAHGAMMADAAMRAAWFRPSADT